MSYLPNAYQSFRDNNADVASALDGLGAAVDRAGPLDEKTMRLVKLAIAIGAEAEGAVRSNVRKALAENATDGEIHQIGLAAITTVGFPAAIAALGWIDEVLSSGSSLP